jgi:hypothetical protein
LLGWAGFVRIAALGPLGFIGSCGFNIGFTIS